MSSDIRVDGVGPITIHWPHRDNFPIETYYESPLGRILLMGCFVNNVRMFHHIRPKDYLLVRIFGEDYEREFLNNRRFAELYELDRSRVWFLCNDELQVSLARSHGFNATFVNNNAFLDENLWYPRNTPKIYDAVSNARLIKWKRTSLARQVGNLAIIPGLELEGGHYDHPEDIPHRFVAQGFLTWEEVAQVLSRAYVGLSLSKAEGACLASSEYLLCGLPVVSTPSIGGRSVWYDDYNSLICDATEAGVKKAVDEMVRRVKSGEVDGNKIRQRKILQMWQHRYRFIELLVDLFHEMGVALDAEQYFKARFNNNMHCWQDWRCGDPSAA